MYMYNYTYIYIRELAHARPPMSSISVVIYTRNAHAHIFLSAGHGRRLRTYVPSPDHTSLRMRACIRIHVELHVRMHACVHTRVTFRPESKSDLGSCETIRKLRSVWLIESRTRLAYGTRLA